MNARSALNQISLLLIGFLLPVTISQSRRR
jgi:hypothetical protein